MNNRTGKIRAWMALNGVKAIHVVEANRPISSRAVQRYIAGTMSSSRLQAWFIAQGCPPKHLAPAKRPAKSKSRKAA